MKPSVKVCGVKDPAFAAAAARRGVDYLGVIFAASSPRAVTCAAAQAVAAAARAARPVHPPRIVGVFVSHAVPEIVSLAAAVPLDVVQLHGRYDAAAVQAIQAAGREVWRLSAAPGDAGVGEDAALLDGRTAVGRIDVAQAYLPVMRHRIALTFDAQMAGETRDTVLESILKEAGR